MIKVKKVAYSYDIDYNEDVVNFEYIITKNEFANDEAEKIFTLTHLGSYYTNGDVVIKITETFSSKQWHELKKEIQNFIEQHTESIKEAIKKINDFVVFLESLTSREI